MPSSTAQRALWWQVGAVGIVWLGTSQHGEARRGTTWHSVLWHGVAHGPARQGDTWASAVTGQALIDPTCGTTATGWRDHVVWDSTTITCARRFVGRLVHAINACTFCWGRHCQHTCRRIMVRHAERWRGVTAIHVLCAPGPTTRSFVVNPIMTPPPPNVDAHTLSTRGPERERPAQFTARCGKSTPSWSLRPRSVLATVVCQSPHTGRWAEYRQGQYPSSILDRRSRRS